MSKNLNKAIFLDRDGVINEELGDYVTRTEDFKILPHVGPNLLRLKEAGYKIIVITNQGGLAKKLYTKETLEKMHRMLSEELSKDQIRIDELYYCPHHPHSGNCLCRKPASLLLEKALAKHRIDPALSVFIGDKERDIMAAAAVNMRGVLIQENQDWTFVVDEMLS